MIQDDLIRLVQEIAPGITMTELAARLGVHRSAAYSRQFSAKRAVDCWNAAGHPEIQYIPPGVKRRDGGGHHHGVVTPGGDR